MVRLYFKRGRVRTGCRGSAQNVARSLQVRGAISRGALPDPGADYARTRGVCIAPLVIGSSMYRSPLRILRLNPQLGLVQAQALK